MSKPKVSKPSKAPKDPNAAYGFSKKTTPWVYDAIHGKGVGKGMSSDQVINTIAQAQMHHRQADPLDFPQTQTVRHPGLGGDIYSKFGEYRTEQPIDNRTRLNEMFEKSVGVVPGKPTPDGSGEWNAGEYGKNVKTADKAVGQYLKALRSGGLTKSEAMHKLAESIVQKKHLDPEHMLQDTYTGKLLSKANDPSTVVSMIAHKLTDQRKQEIEVKEKVADNLDQYLNWNTKTMGKRPYKPTTGFSNLVPTGTPLTPDNIRAYAAFLKQPSQIQQYTIDKIMKGEKDKQSMKDALDTVQGTSTANMAAGKGKYGDLRALLMNLGTGGTFKKPTASSGGTAGIDPRVAGVK